MQSSARRERARLCTLQPCRLFCARAGGQACPRVFWGLRLRGSFRPGTGEKQRFRVRRCHRSAVAFPGWVRDAASGGGRPVGGRTAAQREEDSNVGLHRAPSPQGGRLEGGLLQRLFRARRGHGAVGCRACSASGASPGRRSEGFRTRVRAGGGSNTGPGEPGFPSASARRLLSGKRPVRGWRE